MSMIEASEAPVLCVPETGLNAGFVAGLFLDKYETTSETDEELRVIEALTDLTGDFMPTYDKRFLSYPEALAAHTGNCMTRSALLAELIGFVGSYAAIPSIRSSRPVPDSPLTAAHASLYARMPSGDFVFADSYDASYYFHRVEGENPADKTELTLAKRPEQYTDKAILQIVETAASEPTFRSDGDTAKPHEGRPDRVDTLFFGTQGLRSYMATIQLLSDKRHGRSTVRPSDVLIPRL